MRRIVLLITLLLPLLLSCESVETVVISTPTMPPPTATPNLNAISADEFEKMELYQIVYLGSCGMILYLDTQGLGLTELTDEYVSQFGKWTVDNGRPCLDFYEVYLAEMYKDTTSDELDDLKVNAVMGCASALTIMERDSQKGTHDKMEFESRILGTILNSGLLCAEFEEFWESVAIGIRNSME